MGSTLSFTLDSCADFEFVTDNATLLRIANSSTQPYIDQSTVTIQDCGRCLPEFSAPLPQWYIAVSALCFLIAVACAFAVAIGHHAGLYPGGRRSRRLMFVGIRMSITLWAVAPKLRNADVLASSSVHICGVKGTPADDLCGELTRKLLHENRGLGSLSDAVYGMLALHVVLVGLGELARWRLMDSRRVRFLEYVTQGEDAADGMPRLISLQFDILVATMFCSLTPIFLAWGHTVVDSVRLGTECIWGLGGLVGQQETASGLFFVLIIWAIVTVIDGFINMFFFRKAQTASTEWALTPYVTRAFAITYMVIGFAVTISNIVDSIDQPNLTPLLSLVLLAVAPASASGLQFTVSAIVDIVARRMERFLPPFLVGGGGERVDFSGVLPSRELVSGDQRPPRALQEEARGYQQQQQTAESAEAKIAGSAIDGAPRQPPGGAIAAGLCGMRDAGLLCLYDRTVEGVRMPYTRLDRLVEACDEHARAIAHADGCNPMGPDTRGLTYEERFALAALTWRAEDARDSVTLGKIVDEVMVCTRRADQYAGAWEGIYQQYLLPLVAAAMSAASKLPFPEDTPAVRLYVPREHALSQKEPRTKLEAAAAAHPDAWPSSKRHPMMLTTSMNQSTMATGSALASPSSNQLMAGSPNHPSGAASGTAPVAAHMPLHSSTTTPGDKPVDASSNTDGAHSDPDDDNADDGGNSRSVELVKVNSTSEHNQDEEQRRKQQQAAILGGGGSYSIGGSMAIADQQQQEEENEGQAQVQFLRFVRATTDVDLAVGFMGTPVKPDALAGSLAVEWKYSLLYQVVCAPGTAMPLGRYSATPASHQAASGNRAEWLVLPDVRFRVTHRPLPEAHAAHGSLALAPITTATLVDVGLGAVVPSPPLPPPPQLLAPPGGPASSLTLSAAPAPQPSMTGSTTRQQMTSFSVSTHTTAAAAAPRPTVPKPGYPQTFFSIPPDRVTGVDAKLRESVYTRAAFDLQQQQRQQHQPQQQASGSALTASGTWGGMPGQPQPPPTSGMWAPAAVSSSFEMRGAPAWSGSSFSTNQAAAAPPPAPTVMPLPQQQQQQPPPPSQQQQQQQQQPPVAQQ